MDIGCQELMKHGNVEKEKRLTQTTDQPSGGDQPVAPKQSVERRRTDENYLVCFTSSNKLANINKKSLVED
jgi:hypothetical protein